MSDNPQQTPNVEKPNTITAMVIAKLELLAQQSQRNEDATLEMAAQIAGLTSAVTAHTDQLLLLTSAVNKFEKTQRDLSESLSGMREGMRRTNSRLRVVEGSGGDDGGLEP